MTLWIVLAAMAAAVIAFTVWPLIRPRADLRRRGEYDAAVYLDQLEELERDRARGLIDGAQAESARIEIERRLLAAGRAAGRADEADGKAAAAPKPVLAAVLIALLPLVALPLYLGLGNPDLPGQPFASRAPAAPEGGEIAERARQAVQAAAAEAEANPDDADAWLALGRLRLLAGDVEGAVTALERAGAVAGSARGDIASVRGEALTRSADGMVTPEARRAFEAAQAADPADPRAAYFLALADYQAGWLREALTAWSELAREAPAGAAWLRTVSARIEETARELGEDPTDWLPAPAMAAAPANPGTAGPARGPSREDMAAAQEMSPEARQEMIRGMVEGLAARLEETPDDVEGWRRLARSREVLGEDEQAAEAYRRALELEPDHPETLLRGGMAAAKVGDTGAARSRLTRLLGLIPPEHEAHQKVQEAIDRLDAAGG